MRISKLLVIVCVFTITWMWFTLFTVGETEWIDAQSVLIMTLTLLTVAVPLSISPRARTPLILVLGTILIVHYALRVITLIHFPYSSSEARFLVIGRDDVHLALWFLLAGVFACMVGLLIVPLRSQYLHDSRLRIVRLADAISPTRLTMFLFAAQLVYFSSTRYAYSGRLPPALGWILYPFSVSHLLPFAVLIWIEKWMSMRRRSKLVIVLYLLLYIGSGMIAGQRSVITYPLTLSFLYLVVTRGDFAINVPKALVAGMIILVISIFIVFPLATSVRQYGGLVSFAARGGQIGDILTERIQDTETLLRNISVRLGYLDPLFAVVAQRGGRVNELLNLGQATKVVLNRLVPGRIFPEGIRTAYLYNVVYFGYPLSLAADSRTNVTGYSGFGIAFVYLGGWLAPFFLLMLCVLASAVLNALIEWQSQWQPVLLMIFAVSAWDFWAEGFGLDELVINAIYRFVGITALLFVLTILAGADQLEPATRRPTPS